MDVQETKRYTGYWWLPNNPSKQVSGSLCIDPRKGVELETVGSLLAREVFDTRQEIFSQEVLLGVTTDGKAITLIDLHNTRSSSNLNSSQFDLSISIYSARLAIIGRRHFINKDEITFTSAAVRFSLVDEWLYRRVFSYEEKVDERGCRKVSVEYACPDSINFYINSIDAYFRTDYVFSQYPSFFKWQIVHKAFLKIAPDQPQSLDWYMEQFYSLQKLLTVMIGFPVIPLAIVGSGNDIPIGENATTKEEFQIYSKVYDDSQEIIEKHPNQLLLAITVPSLGTELSVIVNNWFKKAEILDPATTLYIATLSTRLRYAEFQLLNYAQALEALHRRVFGGKYMLDKEYEPICSELTNSISKTISKDHRNSLKNRIKYGNEFSQRKRIKELLDEVWENCLDQFIDDKKKFIGNVIGTRNYLVHPDESSASEAVFGTEIFYLAERLKVLLVTHLLIQLGIPKENVYRAVKQFDPFHYLKCGDENHANTDIN